MPGTARAVIIGAGITGTSVAYHLAQKGWDDVVCVEQGPLWETGGSTSHAPGLIFQLNPSRTMTQLARWSTELYGGLELDGQPCFYGVGGIEVAATPERWAELDRRFGRALSFGLDAELLDPEGVHERIPLLDPERIVGGLLVRSDGIGKALRAAEALGRHAVGSGALRAFGDCEVTGFEIARGRVRAVETTRGTIRTERVVLCAGVWGPRVLRRAGLRLPLFPVAHQYAITAPLPELAGAQGEVAHPILRHQDRSMYFRQVGDAYGIGSYFHEPRLVDPDDIERSGPGRHPSERPFTPEDFAPAQQEAGELLPALRDARLVRAIDGLMSFTPDGFPLIGDLTGARGLCLAEAIWVTHAGGTGRVVADLLAEGEAALDLHECDPERFDAHGLSGAYARVRAAQQYREVYDILHPRQPALVTRPLRLTPFHERERALGAEFFESAGWERPQWYEANAELVEDGAPPRTDWSARFWSPVAAAEHRACRERVGLFDITPFTKVEVSGPGALAYLQHLAANDVDRRPGTVVYTAMLSPGGKIMCDLTVTRLTEDRFFVVTGGAVGKHDLAWMRRGLPEDGSVHLDDQTSGLCCLGVWGPRARDLASAVTEDDVSNDAFPYMTARELHLGLVPVRMLRISYVGELGWEVYAPVEFGAALWDTLWRAGEPLGVLACGGAAYDSLRLEKGYRLWGADIDEEHDPYEAGLGFAVKLGKGDFLGREAVLRAKEGVRRRLCCLVLADPAVVLVGKEPILDREGGVLGYVTSAAWGATVEESLAYGYLPVEHAAEGAEVAVYADGQRHVATVASEPRFDPASARLRDVDPVLA
ncbi:MAG: FAD-dependent oxidoreductase [Actinomycetota bacterium]|nr:FAD-dependent oxidoreductase [Actinomycetota bacterium]